MDGKRLIEKIRLRNILSFGDKGEEIELQPLNVIIGQNASGKSNLVEVFRLLQSAAKGYFSNRIANTGVTEYLWKGNYSFPIAEIKVLFGFQDIREDLIFYSLKFKKTAQSFEIVEEEIAPTEKDFDQDFYYSNKNKNIDLVFYDENPESSRYKKPYIPKERSKYEPQKLILGSIEENVTGYPVIRKIEELLGSLEIYEDWHFHRNHPPRQSIPLKSNSDFLSEDGQNLAIIIREFKHYPDVYKKVITNLRKVYSRVENLTPNEQSGGVQLFIQEKGMEERIPASRLSNGTLRYLCLLAILCHPEPPPLICIEEPETGLHPDILPTIAELMKEASARTQLIVTTHSDILVSAFSDMPEAVLVCEKDEDGTHFKRLEAKKLKEWLDAYSLGDLWLKGEIGGTRW